jgi:sigma-E factor negative regulatory protein RseB
MRYLALLAVLALPQLAWSGQSPKAWLEKMTRAVHSLSYEGTFVFMHGDRVDTMHIVHGHDQDGVKERLTALTGQARELIRAEGVLTCVRPQEDSVTVEKIPARHVYPGAIPVNTEGLEAYYQFQFAGRDRIAGTPCRVIAIEPQDDLRYGHRLCIAEDSGLLLRSIMLTPGGRPIEEVMFTSIRLRENIPDARFEPTMIEDDYVQRTTAGRYSAIELKVDPGWRIERMPPGFEVTDRAKRVMMASPQPVQHMILTDGLASVSVFIAKPQDAKALFEGTTRSGALNAFARKLNGHQITVVGEVPAETVKMIGQSIVYRPEQG